MNTLVDFKKMHQQDELLLIGNAWDVLSAIILEQSGFKAIATTSWGVANGMGCQDGEGVDFEDVLVVVEKILAAVDIPVSVDIESGYSNNHEVVAANVLSMAKLGVVGINIEDSYKNGSGLKTIVEQSELITKIRSTLDNNNYHDFFINARIDTYFQLKDPQSETIERANAYANSGACGVFVPGIMQSHDIKELVSKIDVPLNVLSLPELTDIALLNELGVKRFSIGNALSDAVIAFIEQQSQQLISKQNTKNLYQHQGVKTQFK
jgi:2-methylisocitrate lyase-like PEP mutase family enzyme